MNVVTVTEWLTSSSTSQLNKDVDSCITIVYLMCAVRVCSCEVATDHFKNLFLH